MVTYVHVAAHGKLEAERYGEFGHEAIAQWANGHGTCDGWEKMGVCWKRFEESAAPRSTVIQSISLHPFRYIIIH